MMFTTLSINMDNTDKITVLLKDIKFKKFTKEQAVEALNAYYNVGLCEASRNTNIPKRKILDWLNPGRNAKYCQTGLENNYEKRQKHWQDNYKANPDLYKTRMKEMRRKQGIEGTIKQREYMRKWRDENREHYQSYLNAYERERMQNDVYFRLKKRLRDRFKNYFKSKTSKIDKYTGCTIPDLKHYLEMQFTPEMNWDNQGSYWHIDHIKPIGAFDLTKEADLKQVLHYTNLQPLSGAENLIKNDKIIPKTLGIINCAKTKKDRRCTANEMYDNSTLFLAMKNHCLKEYHNCKILSAKYGLLDLFDLIEPYESLTLCEGADRKNTKVMPHAERRIWAATVYKSFDWNSYDAIHLHISKYYWEYLEPYLKNHNNIFYHPYESGIGINIANYQNKAPKISPIKS